jgi:hypothetical protein
MKGCMSAEAETNPSGGDSGDSGNGGGDGIVRCGNEGGDSGNVGKGDEGDGSPGIGRNRPRSEEKSRETAADVQGVAAQ